ncbi:MAG TPA: hypothetical protein VFX59_15340 [Polyangiales bacterium]|nr:hypothetical protein [Polyangiales bacterium]
MHDVFDALAEAFARLPLDPVGAVAAILDVASELDAADSLPIACLPVAKALRALVHAVHCISRDHSRLWQAVLGDPLEADLHTAAAAARRVVHEAEHAIEDLGNLLQPRGCGHASTPSDAAVRLATAEWLELIELQLVVERRAARSPLQLFRLAQITRVHATHRAQQLLVLDETRSYLRGH